MDNAVAFHDCFCHGTKGPWIESLRGDKKSTIYIYDRFDELNVFSFQLKSVRYGATSRLDSASNGWMVSHWNKIGQLYQGALNAN